MSMKRVKFKQKIRAGAKTKLKGSGYISPLDVKTQRPRRWAVVELMMRRNMMPGPGYARTDPRSWKV